MNNKDGNFISAVIYFASKDDEIDIFLEFVNSVLSKNFKKYEIICVDDAMGEESCQVIHSFKKKHPDVVVSLVRMGFHQGVEASMSAGVDHSIGDFVFEFDSCFADYDGELIMEVYQKAQAGFDIISAIPPVKRTRMTSRLFYQVFNSFSSAPNALRSERFCLLSRRAINRISAYSKAIPYRKAIYASVGLKTANVSYIPKQEQIGRISTTEGRSSLAIDSLVIFTNIAYKLALFLTLLMALFMVIAGTYTVIVYFGQRRPVEGWAPIMGLISVGFFAVFAILSVLIKYADVILRLVFVRQNYLVLSVEKL